MDSVKAFQLEMLSRQDAMNSVIDRFESPVQQFYSGAVVFVTGGSGFLGKQLVEKLFRATQLSKVYMLIRNKKGQYTQERLRSILKDPVYDGVREKQPNFADKIIPIEGDVSEIRLGISDKDWTTITSEVDVIFHMAATTRFDEPLRVATLINVRGTREVINLARECSKLRSYVHVSTAYSHATPGCAGAEVLEQFYPSPVPPDVIIRLAETVDNQRLDDITAELIKGWPNTYTFTKAVAEEAVRTMAADLPVCVVRPPIVVCSYVEPKPGWLDLSTVFGATGVFTGIMTGVMHVFFVDKSKKLELQPVDYVNNAVIAAGWDSGVRYKEHGNVDTPIYAVAENETHLSFGILNSVASQHYEWASPKAVWFCYLIMTKIKALYWVLLWLLHYIPAYVIDGLCTVLNKKPKGITSFVKLYTKMDKMASTLSYFVTHEWIFRNDNLKSMFDRLSAEDKLIFNFDLKTIDLHDYTKVWLLGVREYIMKDGLKNSEVGYRKQTVFKYLSFAFLILYAYVVYNIIMVVVSLSGGLFFKLIALFCQRSVSNSCEISM